MSVAWFEPLSFAVGCLGGGLLLALAWAIGRQALAGAAAGLRHRGVRLALMPVVGLGVPAFAYALILAQYPAPPGIEGLDLGPGVEESRQLVPLLGCSLYTDRGRPVAAQTDRNLEASRLNRLAQQEKMFDRQGLHDQVIAVPDEERNCNCHGFVFAAGRCWVDGTDVPHILADNGYRVVDQPRPGDVAVYRDADGKVLHTALVRTRTDDGLILVEGKWGGLGRFIHRHDVHCYVDAHTCTFYRSPRAGHALRGAVDGGTSKPPILNLSWRVTSLAPLAG